MKESSRPPLDEQVSLKQAIVAYEGVTTGPGDAGGLSIVDLGLAGFGANTFRSFIIQIHPADPTRVDASVATAFNDVTGKVTVDVAFKGGQVLAGVAYKVITPSPTSTTIIADLGIPGPDAGTNILERDVIGNKTDTAQQTAIATASAIRYLKGLLTALGDPTGDTLTSIAAKWGNIARSLTLILGARWDGGSDLGTDIATIIAGLGGVPTLHASGTQAAIVGTEHIVATAAVAGKFTFHVSKANMVDGDVLELRFYQKILTGGAINEVAYYMVYHGAQPADDMVAISEVIPNDLVEANALQFTLKQSFGAAGRNFAWKVVKQ